MARDFTWGARLRQARAEAGATQKEAARAIGLTTARANQRIGKIEVEEETPTPAELRALCEFYNVTADWILFGRDPKRPASGGERERLGLIRELSDVERLEDADVAELTRTATLLRRSRADAERRSRRVEEIRNEGGPDVRDEVG